jgi:hypothetical protein
VNGTVFAVSCLAAIVTVLITVAPLSMIVSRSGMDSPSFLLRADPEPPVVRVEGVKTQVEFASSERP